MFRRFAAPSLTALALALLTPACSSLPTDLDRSLRHPSAEGKFMVQMEPPAVDPAINQMHAWQVRLQAHDGAPVSQARIAFAGGMPQHGHGFPTKPRVTREAGARRLRARGHEVQHDRLVGHAPDHPVRRSH